MHSRLPQSRGLIGRVECEAGVQRDPAERQHLVGELDLAAGPRPRRLAASNAAAGLDLEIDDS
jgi:hypothetical protein